MGTGMKIVEVTDRTPDLMERLLEVWESSVRATHLFLSDGEIKSICTTGVEWGCPFNDRRRRRGLPRGFYGN